MIIVTLTYYYLINYYNFELLLLLNYYIYYKFKLYKETFRDIF